jgi:hypothetical protein
MATRVTGGREQFNTIIAGFAGTGQQDRSMAAKARAPEFADASRTTTDYFLCGLRVRATVPLPDLLAWIGDDRTPDVIIRLGTAPALLDPVLQGSGPVQVGRDGTCRLAIKDVASFLVLDGRTVIVEPHGDLDTPAFRGWLLGAVLGMVCHQRGLYPLHAACVRIGGNAIALCGRTGAGKSTLAAALVRRGHALIADDVCVIDFAANGEPLVLPSFPRVKLWEDALQALAVPAEAVRRAGSGKRKFHFHQTERFDPSPALLRGIYVLKRSAVASNILCKSGVDAVNELLKEIYRRPIGFSLGHKAALLTAALRIASKVPLFQLSVRLDLSQLDATAARIEGHFASANRPDNA